MPSFKDVRRWAPTRTEDCGLRTERSPSPESSVLSPQSSALVEAARVEGFRSGREEGLRQASEEQGACTQSLARVAAGVLVESEDFLRSLEQEVLDLSLAVAEKVIEHEARIDRTIVLGVIRGALEEVRGATVVEVHLNPKDYDLVAERWQQVAPESVLERGQLVADDRIQEGGCVIETLTGRVDAQLASKLDRLRDALHAMREGEPG